jgi:hypothetical protein
MPHRHDWRRIARDQYSLITRRQALSAGRSPSSLARDLSAGRLDRLGRGIYRVSGGSESWRQRVKSVTLTGAIACRRTAAAVYGFKDVPAREIEVLVVGSRSTRDPRCKVHRTKYLPDSDVRVVQGIPLTSPARTLLELGAVCPREVVRRAMQNALHSGLVTLAELLEELRRCGRMGRPGTAIFRHLLLEYDFEGACEESELEAVMIRRIQEAGLPRPHVQYPIREDDGACLARIDGAYPELGIALEADGHEFHSAFPDWVRDRRKQNALVSRGWVVLRFTREDGSHPLAFLMDLERTLARKSREVRTRRRPR